MGAESPEAGGAEPSGLAPRSAEHPRGATEVAPGPRDLAADMLSAWVAASAADVARRKADPAADAGPRLEPFDPFPDAPIGPPSFWSELKRREIFQSIAVYVLIALGVLQAVYVVIPGLGLDDRLWDASLVAAAVGLPIALVMAWFFDLTPEGVRRDPGADHVGLLPPATRWPRYLAVIGIALVLALVCLAMYLRLSGDV